MPNTLCTFTAHIAALFFYYYYFLKFWLCWVFTVAGRLFVVVQGLLTVVRGLSCCNPRASLVVDMGSRVHGLTSCGMQALECAAL